MALRKAFTHPDNGTPYLNAYWRLRDEISVHVRSRTIKATLDVFASRSAYQSGYTPVYTTEYQISGQDFADIRDAVKAVLYPKVKRDRMPDAEDVD